MNVYIRDVNPSVVAALDEMASRVGKSRSVFLKELLTNFVEEPAKKTISDNYERLLELALDTLERNTQQMQVMQILLEQQEGILTDR